MPTTPTDAELMLAHLEGEEGAFGQLYSRYASKLLNTAYRYVQDEQAAEDVVQEVFLKVARYQGDRNEWTGRYTVSSWLYIQVKSRCLDHLRKRKFVLLGDKLPDEAAETVDMTLSRKFERCLDALKPAQRDTLIALAIYGLSRREYAERLELPEGTVAGRMRIARDNMKRCLGAEARP